MAFPGLPSNVGHPGWQEWLSRFPPISPPGLSAAMRYRREMLSHLDLMPPAEWLSAEERRRVGDDLAHYCRILQGTQETSVRAAVTAVGGKFVSLAGSLYFPGAEVPLLFLAGGFGIFGAGRIYDIKRRESIIAKLIKRIDALSWNLKR